MAILNPTQLHALILANLPNNNTEFISPELLREVVDTIVDSYFNLITDINNVGLSEYNPTITYSEDKGVFFEGDLFQALTGTTAGAFNSSEWELIAPFSSTTADFVTKDKGIELDASKHSVLLADDASLLALGTGMYEANGVATISGLDQEYPILGKASLQTFLGSSNSRSLQIFRPYSTPSIFYIRNLNADWVKMDIGAIALTYTNGIEKIGNEIRIGGGYDGINLNANSNSSTFNITGGEINLTPNAARTVLINGSTFITKGNQNINVNSNDISISSNNQVTIQNLKPSNKATYLIDVYGSGSTTTNDLDIPDFGLVRRHVDLVLDAAALGADFVNGLTATTVITSAVTATTVGLGGSLSQNTVVDLSGNTLSFSSPTTITSISPNEVQDAYIDEGLNVRYGVKSNSSNARLFQSNSGGTSDQNYVSVTSVGVDLIGDVTHNAANRFISTSPLTTFNSEDFRLPLIPDITIPTGTDLSVIWDSVSGKVRVVPIDNLGITGSTGPQGPYNGNANGSIEPVSGSNQSTGDFATIIGGQNNFAQSPNTIVGGFNATGSGNASFSVGYETNASGDFSNATNFGTTSVGTFSHAEGYNTTSDGVFSHAEGQETLANGVGSHAEGKVTVAGGAFSHAEGYNTTASQDFSHAEGISTLASNYASHAEGFGTVASGDQSHAEGDATIASGSASHSEGYITKADGNNSHAEGSYTLASGINSHAEGFQTIAKGGESHAEGRYSIATGGSSHAEGKSTMAAGYASHSEGYQSEAVGLGDHAEGGRTNASGGYSHAEGRSTISNGYVSHAEGYFTTASGDQSHAGGSNSTASGIASFIHSNNSEVEANNAVILGGFGNRLTSVATGSTVLGGTGITGTSFDTVYTPDLDVQGIYYSGGTPLTDIFTTAAGTNPFIYPVLTVAVDTTLDSNDIGFVSIITTGITVTLPNSPVLGSTFILKDGSGLAENGSIIISGGTANIDGESTQTLDTNYASINVTFNGTQYLIS